MLMCPRFFLIFMPMRHLLQKKYYLIKGSNLIVVWVQFPFVPLLFFPFLYWALILYHTRFRRKRFFTRFLPSRVSIKKRSPASQWGCSNIGNIRATRAMHRPKMWRTLFCAIVACFSPSQHREGWGQMHNNGAANRTSTVIRNTHGYRTNLLSPRFELSLKYIVLGLFFPFYQP